jgi:hypothetical protein
MKLEISNAEKMLFVTHQALDNELELKISSLRAEYKAHKENLDQKSRLDTQGVRLKLQGTERSLELEQEFVSGLRKIPDEIVVEILQWHLQDRTPPRTLALVCKGWKTLLLHTPSFWRALKAHLVHPDSLERDIDTLSKRIALSRSTQLDITLCLLSSSEHSNDIGFPLFQLIAQTGIERWRSLKLQCIVWPTSHPSLEGMFRGTASNLQKLELPIESGPFSQIYKIILQSRPRITEVTFAGAVPLVFQDSTIFQRASKVTADATVFQQLAPFKNLQELCIAGLGHALYASLPPLAAHTELHYSVTRWQLYSLQRQNVVSLYLWTIADMGMNAIIDFPELISLSINNNGITALERISAPKLAKLSLALRRTDARSRKLETSRTMDIVLNKPQNITIRPTSLIMALSISTTTVLAILQLWPQLQHLELTFGDEFAWKGAFPNAFTRKKNPLCPKLVTLRLQSYSGSFAKDIGHWEEIAKLILATRKGSPLNKIEWNDAGGDWHRLPVSN